jgi:hypothetical protein
MREAQATGSIGSRKISLPGGAHFRVDGRLVRAASIEIAFEEVSLPANTLIDFSGRFPDVLRDVFDGKSWLIEDPERALKASRTGLDLTLGFPDEDDVAFVEIDALKASARSAELEANLNETVASLSLNLALGVLAIKPAEVEAPKQFLDLLTEARGRFTAGNLVEAARLYEESLRQGTALEALCNLAYIAVERREYDKCVFYSATAAKRFPLDPHGPAN